MKKLPSIFFENVPEMANLAQKWRKNIFTFGTGQKKPFWLANYVKIGYDDQLHKFFSSETKFLATKNVFFFRKLRILVTHGLAQIPQFYQKSGRISTTLNFSFENLFKCL